MGDFKPFLLAALDNHEDSQVGIAAVGVVSDLCRSLETNILAYMDEIMEKLLAILQDPNVKKSVKTQVLNAFGDIALALNGQYSRYLELNMKWLAEAIAAAQVTNSVKYLLLFYLILIISRTIMIKWNMWRICVRAVAMHFRALSRQ